MLRPRESAIAVAHVKLNALLLGKGCIS